MKWNRDRIDAIARAVQWLCGLAVAGVVILYFLPGHPADGIVFGMLEWRFVELTVLFLAASVCRRQKGQGVGLLALAALAVVWFFAVRWMHLRVEGTAKTPGAFLGAYGVCLLFARLTGDDRRCVGLKVLMAVFTAVSLLFTVYGGLLVLDRLPALLEETVYWDGARLGILSHPNIAATMLMLGSGLMLSWAVSTKRLWLRVVLICLTALEFCVMALTNSRTTVLLSCACYGGILFCALGGRSRKRGCAALLAAVVLMGSLLVFSQKLFRANEARLKAQSSESGETNLKAENGQGDMKSDLRTLNGRTDIWAAAVQGIRRNPRILLMGTEHAGEIISPYWEKMDVLHTHNSWVQTLYELGLPGLGIALALTALAVWNGACLMWRNDDVWRSGVVMVLACLMGCAFLEPYLFTVDLQYCYFDFFFLTCLGYLIRWRGESAEGEKKHV